MLPLPEFRDIGALWRAEPERLRERQQERLQQLVAHARAHSPFYADRYRHLPDAISDVRQLPPVTKREIQADFDRVVTDPAVRKADVATFAADRSNLAVPYLGRYVAVTTSGTTGQPGVFLQDAHWNDVMDALTTLRLSRSWFSHEVMEQMIALGGRTASIFNDLSLETSMTTLERQRQRHPGRAARMHAFPIHLPMEELVGRLNRLQPAQLSTYASMLGALAEEQQEGRLDIHPAVVISSAEALDAATQARVEAAFGVPPRDLYASTEGGVMGFSCGHGRMHLNADWVILEPKGDTPEEGVYLTSLANRILPVLRYELNDAVRFHNEACPCGLTLPVIEVGGRTSDLLRFTDQAGKTVRVPPLALTSLLERAPGLRRFQVYQADAGTVRVRLETLSGDGLEPAWAFAEAELRRYFDGNGLRQVHLLLDGEPPSRDPRSGKFRTVWSALIP